MNTAPPQEPLRPADAYWIVEKMVAPAYFLVPPPSSGVVLGIAGTDGVQTEWAMGRAGAAGLAALVIAHPDLRLIAERTYEARDAA